MQTNNEPNPTVPINEILAAARQTGVEVDAREAAQWIVAMSSAERQDTPAQDAIARDAIAQDAGTGIFGHRVALLDFDADDLAYFRRLAKHVRVVAHPNVESAISISGSSAQGKVQLFPGDCDFFERVNIHAPDMETAKKILREVLRATALRAFSEPDIVLIEANLGAYTQPVRERGQARTPGDAITWTPQDVANGYIDVEGDVSVKRLYWDEVEAGKGWTYLGWIVADRERGRIALASNMLDVTWEAPDGSITSLDGSVDPLFQEIYLEANELPILKKLAREITPDALNTYKNMMRAQVLHYTHEEPNFGKASKRLYNLFRLTDQLEAAAYVRELFDEPSAQLYQVPGLLEAAEIALRDPRAEIDRGTVLKQIDLVARQVKDATEGKDEARILAELARLRNDVLGEPPGADWDQVLQEVRKGCAEIVNEFFRTRLFGYAAIKEFVEGLKTTGS
jgi:hypothetical protein